jgi:hypothetical protein
VAVLTQFLFRMAFGMALAMAVTPARLVTSGYFRNQAYVLLGLNVLASLVAASRPHEFPLWPSVAAAVLSYLASVLWLYERPRAGSALLGTVAATSLAGAWLTRTAPGVAPTTLSAETVLAWLDPLAGGLVLGATLAAMLLGHWYLNTPGMRLAPLLRLVKLAAAAIVLRGLLCGAGLALEVALFGARTRPWQLFILLRWLAGVFGALGLLWMTWKTLTQQRPNTQSATGILYVAVLATLLGELAAQLLSAEATYPL